MREIISEREGSERAIMEVSGKLNERLGAHQGVFQEYSAGGASRATTLFTVLVLVSKGNRAAILGRPLRWLYSSIRGPGQRSEC